MSWLTSPSTTEEELVAAHASPGEGGDASIWREGGGGIKGTLIFLMSLSVDGWGGV